jgi:signal transduction histidine kinase
MSKGPPRVEHDSMSQRPMRKKSPSTQLKWYESWIIRAAAVVTLTLGVGYSVSAYFTFASIRAVAKLAHDPAMEQALGAYLDTLKNTHALKNDLILARLLPHIKPVLLQGRTQLTVPEVTAWLKEADFGPLSGAQEATITTVSGGGKEFEWLDRSRLRLLNIVLEFPRGSDYENFKTIEDLKQRYQMIGVRLEEQIRPTLMRASLVTLIVTFVILIGLLIVMAQKFKHRLNAVIEGFSLWSEENSEFRFASDYHGELKLITRQFNTMADEVDANKKRSLYLEKIASWQVIARKLAHEIKNPLTPIQMMVSQLKRRYKGSDEAFAHLLDECQSIVSEEIQNLRRMVDDFAQFAKLPEPRLKSVDLIQLTRRSVELQKNALTTHQLSLHVHTTPGSEIWIAKVDDDLLRQVLVNLIKNAAEASGEQSAHIEIHLKERSDEYLIEVKDDGPGIPQEHLGRIFEAYFTTKHTGPNPGMGLGLAVCQKIILDHKGQLLVSSRPGATIFTIKLPR